jgi:predicted DNA-binding protein
MAVNLSSSPKSVLDDGFSATFETLKPQKEPEEPLVQLAGPSPTGEPPAATAPKDPSGMRAAGESQIAAEAQERKVKELKSAQAKGETAAKEAREAAVYAEYKPRLTAPYETFKPTGDTASGLASLGLMIGMLGAMGGKKGLTSATGAMNAIAGMMTGYQEGSKEKYERERKNFEENLKVVQQNHALVEKEFERAVKYAKYDLTGATNAMIKSSLARGDTTTANSLETRGLMKTSSEWSQAGGKFNGEIKKETDKMFALQETAKRAQIEVEARKAETPKAAGRFGIINGVAGFYTNEHYAQATAQGLSVSEIAKGGRADKVPGQRAFIENVVGKENMPALGDDETKKVASTIKAADRTASLADDIEKYPFAAGVIGSTYAAIDKFIPQRYQPGDAVEPAQFLAKTSSVDLDPALTKDLTVDEIAKAREIQKKAVDVINARALAASGGGRLLIAELNMQKGVLDISGQSPTSAIKVYRALAESDIADLEQYNLSENALKRVREKFLKPQVAPPSQAYQGDKPPPSYPNARKAPDGFWYVPDPKKPGSYLQVQ